MTCRGINHEKAWQQTNFGHKILKLQPIGLFASFKLSDERLEHRRGLHLLVEQSHCRVLPAAELRVDRWIENCQRLEDSGAKVGERLLGTVDLELYEKTTDLT